MVNFYSHLRIGLNCKNLQKAERLKNKIESSIQLIINDTKFIVHENDLIELTGYCHLTYRLKEEALFNWLIHLNQLGYNWQVNTPIVYEDYFSFEGERWSNPQSFKISGLTFMSFELTDRNLNYPFQMNQKVKVLETEFTIEQGITNQDAIVSSIGNKTNGIWYFGIHIDKLGEFMLSEKDLKTL
jgi:hypothetical protein